MLLSASLSHVGCFSSLRTTETSYQDDAEYCCGGLGLGLVVKFDANFIASVFVLLNIKCDFIVQALLLKCSGGLNIYPRSLSSQ